MVTISPDCIKRTLNNLFTLTQIFTLSIFLFSLNPATACVYLIKGKAIQGGLILFNSGNAIEIKLDGKEVALNSENGFVIGFHRDELASRMIEGLCKDGSPFSVNLRPTQRNYKIQKIDETI